MWGDEDLKPLSSYSYRDVCTLQSTRNPLALSVRGGNRIGVFFDLGDADVSVVRAEGASFEDVDGLNRSRLDAALSSPAFFCIVIR